MDDEVQLKVEKCSNSLTVTPFSIENILNNKTVCRSNEELVEFQERALDMSKSNRNSLGELIS